jgi:hypothetical protein
MVWPLPRVCRGGVEIDTDMNKGLGAVTNVAVGAPGLISLSRRLRRIHSCPFTW